VGAPNSWFYTVTFLNNSTVGVTITGAVSQLDTPSTTFNTPMSLTIGAGGTGAFSFQWCPATSGTHTVQSTFSGTDGNSRPIVVTGPGTVTLQGVIG
jgi:hypothetical protein